MIFQPSEIKETLRMIESENFDIRTVTMGINLLDCVSDSLAKLLSNIEEKIKSLAGNLIQIANDVQGRYGIPIINKRISVTPVSLIAGRAGVREMVAIAQTLDRIAQDLGIDFIAGYSTLVHKGTTAADRALLESIPEALSVTSRLNSCANVASTKTGINLAAIRQLGHLILDLAKNTARENAIGCAKFVVFANAVEDNPFVAGAFHGTGEADCAINVGVSGPGVVLRAIERLNSLNPNASLESVVDTIKRISFKITRAGELVGREMVSRLGDFANFGIVDLSLAPTPAAGDSVANILEAIGLEKTGTHGTTAILALLTDAVKKGGLMASTHVGGLSGAFIPVSEDAGMVEAVEAGALSLDKCEAMTSVCSVGLDMIAIPGDTPPSAISGIIADEIAIGVMNGKTTAVRIIPVPGKKVGDKVSWGGLLGEAPIMAVNRFSCEKFMARDGRIPAPIQGFRN
jgi:uncharacterized protein (UPF0210 family)